MDDKWMKTLDIRAFNRNFESVMIVGGILVLMVDMDRVSIGKGILPS
jgi:hypothetical protein